MIPRAVSADLAVTGGRRHAFINYSTVAYYEESMAYITRPQAHAHGHAYSHTLTCSRKADKCACAQAWMATRFTASLISAH
eukprot:2769333-Pleurochrysis_carterae.AAC.1